MSDRPNILFFLPDQHRFDFVGFNSAYPVRTPNLDRLALDGMRFDNAFCPSPLCAPSRACLAAGKVYDRCRVPGNQIDYPLDQPTYYQKLRDEGGYFVAGVGKFDLHKATRDWGLDGKRLLPEWGFSDGIDNEGKYDGVGSGAEDPQGPYLAFLHERGLAQMHAEDFRQRHGFRDTFPTPLPEEAYCDNWVAANGMELLRDFPKDHPWHLVINFTGPHNPMDVTARMHKRWEEVDFPPAHGSDELDAEHHVRIRRNYAAMIENIDRHVGRFITAVTERDELENTVIVYSSDHGEMLGDHERWGKSTYYQPSVGVPLVISGPGVMEGEQSAVPVSLHDLTATFLEQARLSPLPGMDSQSLTPLLSGETEKHREVVSSGLGEWRVAFDGRFKLVRFEDGRRLLFDLEEDPWEDRDIAEQAAGEGERLATQLDREMAGDGC